MLDAALDARKRSDDRRFWVINIVTYTAVFLLFPILSALKLQDYILPGFVASVGLHFFPMPPLYQHTANLLTGACLVVWPVVCVVLFKPDGDRIAACTEKSCRRIQFHRRVPCEVNDGRRATKVAITSASCPYKGRSSRRSRLRAGISYSGKGRAWTVQIACGLRFGQIVGGHRERLAHRGTTGGSVANLRWPPGEWAEHERSWSCQISSVVILKARSSLGRFGGTADMASAIVISSR